MLPAIEIQNLSKAYGAVQALSAVDLNIPQGEFFALLGPNGAGKTTLISLIAGLAKADTGYVRVMGHDVVRDYRQSRRSLGVVPQELVFDPFFTVLETLRLQSGYYGLRRNNQWIDQILHHLDLTSKADANMRSLSGGMKRRVLVARTTLGKPDLIVLDEPTAGVDVTGEIKMYDLISEFRTQLNCAILMVSHDLHLVMSKTDQVLCLNQHLCCSDLPESVSKHPEYLALFGAQAADSIAVYTHHHDHVHDVSGQHQDRHHD